MFYWTSEPEQSQSDYKGGKTTWRTKEICCDGLKKKAYFGYVRIKPPTLRHIGGVVRCKKGDRNDRP